jgi:hypothetical protein
VVINLMDALKKSFVAGEADEGKPGKIAAPSVGGASRKRKTS